MKGFDIAILAIFSKDICMVVITFPDSETQKKALGFLLGRFSGKVLKNGEHIVPEVALAALADQNISFTVHGKASYEKQIAALRSAASGAVQ
jgi:hypothetical protein